MVSATPAVWTAARLGDLAEDLGELEAAHGTVEAHGEQLAELLVRLVDVLGVLASDLHAVEAAPTRQPVACRPALRLHRGGRS